MTLPIESVPPRRSSSAQSSSSTEDLAGGNTKVAPMCAALRT